MTTAPGRETALTVRARGLARFTIAYNVVEAAVSIAVGVSAGLVSVLGFGLDAVVESLAAGLVVARLSARLSPRELDERAERRSLRLVAATFFLLAGYVTVRGVFALVNGDTPETPWPAIAILALSVVVMPVLATLKRRVGLELRDNLVLADAAETRVCVLLSISTLAGLALYAATGATWLDPAAGFVIAAFAVREGLEAWDGELED